MALISNNHLAKMGTTATILTRLPQSLKWIVKNYCYQKPSLATLKPLRGMLK
jgi:hypothetical protein